MYYVIHYLDEKKKYFKEISILLDFMLPSWTPLSTMDSSLHSNYETLFPLVYNITNSWKDLDIENENAQKLYGKCSRCSSTCQSNLALYYLSIINTNVVKLDNLSLVSIALLELRVYNTYGHLQEPMIKCCKFVLENTDCDYMKTRVLQMLCLVGIPLDDPLWSQLNSFIEFLSTQAVKGDKSTANNRLILANLYILKYSSIIQNLMKQKINELLFSGVNTVDEIPCDGVSIRNEEDNFKNIEMSISNWLIVLDTKHDLTDEINDYNTLKIIYHLINVTELHNHSIYTIQLILILYRMSLFAKNSLYQMRALIYLLKYVQCSELYTQIVDEGKHILKNLYKDDNNKNSDKCYLELSFLLNQSYNLLMRKQFTEGYQILKIAQDEFSGSDMEIQHSRIFRAQIDFLRLKYYNLPCEISVDQEHKSLLSQTSECYEFIAALLKRTSQRNEQSDNLLRILQYFIEISQWIINLYLNLNQPRESRCYIKNILKMLSTLNLPLRYAQMLCLQNM
ncbi:uncharacterized protein LOC123298756 [Chrysoperla carnea]|uniref:uncharacterized protein LOC123298756 n=1 Tax=Chrysoperla carnea TaxID=189513 RepID=UPI001D086B58|nr:uncharacterized protein LOC123298756 [Chrysoperla carnea]